MKELLNKPLPTIPADIQNNLYHPRITRTPLEKCDLILVTDALQNEVGYANLEANGYENNFSDTRVRHEIYLSDARKVAPEKWKTVIRHPIKKR